MRMFKKCKTKRRYCADYILSDSNVASVSNCFHYLVTMFFFFFFFLHMFNMICYFCVLT